MIKSKNPYHLSKMFFFFFFGLTYSVFSGSKWQQYCGWNYTLIDTVSYLPLYLEHCDSSLPCWTSFIFQLGIFFLNSVQATVQLQRIRLI